MKAWFYLLIVLGTLQSCGDGLKTPDVSDLQAITRIERFDQDFFALDTLNLDAGLNRLARQYPGFLPDYLVKVLGVNPADPQAHLAIKAFLQTYRGVYDTAQIVAKQHLPVFEKNLQQGLKYLQYYFPQWKPDSPFVITPFIGPMDALEPFATGDYGDVRTRNGVGIALQFHLGAAAGIYEEGLQAGILNAYQTRRFTPDMMLVNSMKNLVEDLFPYRSGGATLLEEMVEKGKRLYLLDLLLPNTPDSLLIGYTTKQLAGAYENEGLIWNFFVKSDLLYSKDPHINQPFVKDGPKTPELGEASPGYLSLFVGRQMVRAYMKKFPSTSLEDLMKKEAQGLMTEAGYKP